VVEPYAFTKPSALGIEEQRANVAIDLDNPATGLGHGYRVRTDIIVWEGDQVLQVPMTALFKSGGQWSVYRVEAGRARLTPIQIGHMNREAGEVIAGLTSGDRVVEHPSSQVEDGVRVKERNLRETVFVQDQTSTPEPVKSSDLAGEPCKRLVLNPAPDQFSEVDENP
jgi:HlyD family secretion protein